VFYFNQFLHNILNQFFKKNIILTIFKEIEANYLYVYQTKISLKKLFIWILKIFYSDMKPRDTKRQIITQK
jgi:hypothetical protein